MDISDIDLPNYGILKISLDKKDVNNLYTIIKNIPLIVLLGKVIR